MVYAFHNLLNDRTFIQVRSDVMGGRAGEFDPALMGLVVRLRTFESGQERVMDIDRPTAQAPAQVV